MDSSLNEGLIWLGELFLLNLFVEFRNKKKTKNNRKNEAIVTKLLTPETKLKLQSYAIKHSVNFRRNGQATEFAGVATHFFFGK